MSVPGLTGTWQQRNRQLYEKLGSPMGAYQGNLQQNLYLLDQIRKNSYFKGGLPGQQTTAPVVSTAPVTSAGTTAGQSAAPKRVANFATEVMPFEQFWDPNLARSAIAQRTSAYYNPLVENARQGVESDFASRGLTRSSQRGRGVMDVYRDMAEKEQTMREQLYGNIQGQAKGDWGFQQALYEDRPDEYKKSTFDKSNYEYQYPDESPQKYAQSYRDWMRNTYKI